VIPHSTKLAIAITSAFVNHIGQVFLSSICITMSQYDDQPTPDISAIPGAYPQTPGQTPGPSQASSRHHSYQFIPLAVRRTSEQAFGSQTPRRSLGTAVQQRLLSRAPSNARHADIADVDSSAGIALTTFADSEPYQSYSARNERPVSDASTVVQPPAEESDATVLLDDNLALEKEETHSLYSEEGASWYHPIQGGPLEKAENDARPTLGARRSSRSRVSEDQIARVLSQRRKQRPGAISRAQTEDPDELAEEEEIDKLMSRMFGKTRQANSEDEKTRHVGVVWKNLTVKGMGLGAALQPTTGDIFLKLPRFLKGLFTKGPRRAVGKPPVRIILDNFNGCIKPGEMCLVLGRPGAGCSTFLKCLGNQRFGYESVEGDVTYGGTDAATMAKKYRGEVLYNPEDDLHYATLSVKQTLRFALKTRTPDKASRNEGESRDEYIAEFLRVVSKLFWIEHTLGTKVGNAMVRGVSGGEKKRVSIAEAMITKASTQAWDNRYAYRSCVPVQPKLC
jgi:ATP-binding cassette subfamily G (WHITE) protein 2 (SNQ2)